MKYLAIIKMCVPMKAEDRKECYQKVIADLKEKRLLDLVGKIDIEEAEMQ